MSEAAHSKWSASGFEAVMLCSGKKVLEAGLPNTSSKYAAEGTCAHQVLTWALQEDKPAAAYIGRLLSADGFKFTVDEDMAAHVQVCIDYVRDLAGDDGVILVDIRVNYSKYLGVPEDDAWGTADVIVLRGDEVIVVDFKYGAGVEVQAGYDLDDEHHPNPQMALYALGAYAGYGEFGDFNRVRMAISQPRVSVKPSEYDLSLKDLVRWAAIDARKAVIACQEAASGAPEWRAEKRWQQVHLSPNEKSCRFCRAKATCPALREDVLGTVMRDNAPATPEEFADVFVPEPPTDQHSVWLSASLGKVDLIEDWCKAVRAEVERRLLAGAAVPGYKLVEGKQGNRAWSSEADAEALLKSFRLKQEEVYDFSLKSPTQIAKLMPTFDVNGRIKPVKPGTPEPVIGPRQAPKVLALVTRAPPRKHVAPLSDPRPALAVTPVVEDFDDVTAATDLSDLA